MIEIYTKDYCPFCHRAKALLDEKRVPFTEYDVTHDSALEQEMRDRSGGFTVPQIFINDALVGGSDDLLALEKTGRLDSLLVGARAHRSGQTGDHYHGAL